MADTPGMYGSETRAVTQDKNAGESFKFNAVPLGTVMSPKPASFKDNSNLEVLSSTFGKLSTALEQWTEKQKHEDFLVGQMMAAQGRSVEEVQANGGQLAVSGFKAMNTELAASQFQDQTMQDIASSDYQLSPVEFQAKLLQKYRGITSDLPTDDTEALKVLTGQTATIFPKLISVQTAAHAKYINEQTKQTATALLVSKLGDPTTPDEHISQFLDANMNMRNAEEKNAALSNVYSSLAEYSPESAERFKRIVGLPGFTPTGHTVVSDQLSLPSIMQTALGVESYGGKQFNDDGTVLTSSTGRVGATQLSQGAAQDAAASLGIPMDWERVKNDREYNIMIGTQYMNLMYNRFKDWGKAVAAYNLGPTALSSLINTHGDNWRDHLLSVQHGDETAAYLDKYEQKLGSLMPGGHTGYKQEDFITSALQKGFTLEQASAMAAADKKAKDAAGNKFNAARVMTMDALNQAVSSGQETLAGALAKLRNIGDQFSLTDHQLNTYANQLVSASHDSDAQQSTLMNIDAAVNTNRVNELPEKQVRIAFDRYQSSLVGQLSAQIASGKQMTEEQQQQTIQRGIAEFIVKNNNVVDNRISEVMQAAPSLEVRRSNGALNPVLQKAYSMYNALYTAGGAGLANKYAGPAADFFELARKFSAGTDPAEALSAAHDWQMKQRAAGSEPIKAPKILDEDVASGIKSAINELDATIFTGGREQFNSVFQRFNSENNRMASDPAFNSIVKSLAQAELIRNPMEVNPVKKAVNKALSGRVELALGSVLVGNGSTTIAQDCGLAGKESTGAVEQGLVEYLKEEGPKVFGNRWIDKSTLGLAGAVTAGATATGAAVAGPIGAAVAGGSFGIVTTALSHPVDLFADSQRGVPEGYLKYDQNNKIMYFYPRVRDGLRGYALSDVAIPIPAAVIGAKFYAKNASIQRELPAEIAKALQRTKDVPSVSVDGSEETLFP